MKEYIRKYKEIVDDDKDYSDIKSIRKSFMRMSIKEQEHKDIVFIKKSLKK